MSQPVKNAALLALVSSVILLSACTKSDDETLSGWTAYDVTSSTNQVQKATVADNVSGQIAVVWQEIETGSPIADTDATLGAYLCQRTNIRGRVFDGSDWKSTTTIQTGTWRKVASLTDVNDTSPSYHTAAYDAAPQVGIASNGRALAMWTQDGGTTCVDKASEVAAVNKLYSASYDGTSWTTSEMTTGSSSEFIKNISLAMNASGNAIAAWLQGIESPIVYGNSYTSGSGWGTLTTLSGTDFTNYLSARNEVASVTGSGPPYGAPTTAAGVYLGPGIEGQVQTDYSGDYGIVVWKQEEAVVDYTDILSNANAYVPVDAEGDPSGDINYSGTPAQALRAGLRQSIRARLFTTSSGWDMTPAEGLRINKDTNGIGEVIGFGPVDDPKVSINSSGKAWIVWRQSDATNQLANIYNDNGIDWNRNGIIEADIDSALEDNLGDEPRTYILYQMADPNAVDSSTVTISLFTNDVDATGTIGTTHDLQINLAETASVDESTESSQNPNINIDSSGRTAVIWEQISKASQSDWKNSNTPYIWMSLHDGTSWDTSRPIISGRLDNQYSRLLPLDENNFAVIWNQDNDPRISDTPNLKANVYNWSSGWQGEESIGQTSSSTQTASQSAAWNDKNRVRVTTHK